MVAEFIVLHHGAAPVPDGLLPPSAVAEVLAQAFADGRGCRRRQPDRGCLGGRIGVGRV